MLRFWQRQDSQVRGLEPGPGGLPMGTRPWLVLGGGGIKGLTHLGALRVLRDEGFEPVGIVGTSIGALVGACVAGGLDLDDLIDRARRLQRTDIARVQKRAAWVSGFRAEALFRGDTLRAYLEGVLPKGGWRAIDLRFQANAVELGTGRTEWFGIGARTDVSLVDAIHASTALPVFYPPVRLPGGYYVDGGVEFALPVHRAFELGATAVLAIDPGAGEESMGRGVLAGGMLAVHQRVFSIMSGRLRRESVRNWDGPPLHYVRPRIDGYGTFDFEHVDKFIEEGERAMRAFLDEAVVRS